MENPRRFRPLLDQAFGWRQDLQTQRFAQRRVIATAHLDSRNLFVALPMRHCHRSHRYQANWDPMALEFVANRSFARLRYRVWDEPADWRARQRKRQPDKPI
jgi:hypothetical protein